MSRRPMQVGDEVVLTGNHPWAGWKGTVIEALGGRIAVRLWDSNNTYLDTEAMPRQYRRLEAP